jgi:DNA topoisomerase-1
VQSPAVRLLVEREREIRAFDSKSDFAVAGEFAKGRSKIKAAVEKHLASVEEARKLFGDLIGAIFKVDKVDKTPSLRNPGIPFTTSALQQEASAKLGYSAKTTMSAAQKLYQAGHITYMRTDAPTLSGQAIAMIGNYIKNEFGEEYHKVRNFKAKSANAQEAHEAIRPTHVEYKDCGTTSYEKKVYDLIWRRAVASQMVPAEMEKTTINIVNDKNACIFVAKGEVVVKEGFLKVYGGGKDITLPVLGVGDEVKAGEIVARQVFAKPPARYTEGSLVKELEKRGIGRPSTYATILDTIQVRGYAEKGESEGEEREVDEIVLVDGEVSERKAIEKTGANKGKLVPTAAGEVLTSFLTEYFGEVVDYGFTAKTEKELDEIAEGRIERAKMLGAFYEPFHALIEKSGEIDRSKVAQARQIGESPSGLPIFVRFGKFGPYVQEGEDDFEGKRRASLPRGVSLEAVDMKVALKALELPRRVGVFDDGTEVLANVGRFGPYIKVGDKFVSIKAFDPREITLEEALGVWKDKLKADAEKHVRKLEGGIEILKGQYGLYITDGKMNAKFPKDADPLLIPEKEVLEIFEKNKSVPKKRSWGRRKK